jgi:hypothetical protein
MRYCIQAENLRSASVMSAQTLMSPPKITMIFTSMIRMSCQPIVCA